MCFGAEQEIIGTFGSLFRGPAESDKYRIMPRDRTASHKENAPVSGSCGPDLMLFHPAEIKPIQVT